MDTPAKDNRIPIDASKTTPPLKVPLTLTPVDGRFKTSNEKKCQQFFFGAYFTTPVVYFVGTRQIPTRAAESRNDAVDIAGCVLTSETVTEYRVITYGGARIRIKNCTLSVKQTF